MEAMEEFMAHQKQSGQGMWNQGLIPESSRGQDWVDVAVKRSSPWLGAGHMMKSLVTTPREDDGHVTEMVRRKLAQQVRQAPLLTENASDKSESDKMATRCRKPHRNLKSYKVRIIDSTVVKR